MNQPWRSGDFSLVIWEQIARLRNHTIRALYKLLGHHNARLGLFKAVRWAPGTASLQAITRCKG